MGEGEREGGREGSGRDGNSGYWRNRGRRIDREGMIERWRVEGRKEGQEGGRRN